MLAIQEFLSEVIRKYKAGDATEHTYRPALAKLFESLDEKVFVTNEAKRVTDAGSPDFTFRREDRTRGMLTIGHCECKDVGVEVRHPAGYSKEQKERYLEAFPNLLYTNGFEWVFYRDHDQHPIAEIRIADLRGPTPLPENFAELETRLREFVDQKPISITTSQELASRMAAKAKLIGFVFRNALKEDQDFRSELGQQFQVFKDKLIHDITPDDFVGIYAETIAYGLFAARLQDTKTPRDFSREEAFQLLPKSIPFLKNLFQFIGRQDLDAGLARAIDDLVEIFLVSEPWEIMKTYGASNFRNDPFLHFYEDFLAAYDSDKRKKRGVWYTPEPVVDFIVRAVDDTLKAKFGLLAGLADTSKTTIKVQQQAGLTTRGTLAKRAEFKEESVHRVQILDPAVGTGTFLAHTIKNIAAAVKSTAGAGVWPSYVEKELIPRLHGFELLMASYSMCHLKLDMELKATGYTPSSTPPRASVYLTNSLEEGEPPQPVLMLEKWLADEAREANRIKSEKPIMCIIGNPPYNSSSANMADYARKIVQPYKQNLAEQRIHLDDDYIKFIRLAEMFVEKAKRGLIAYICNSSFLSGVTHRRMREHLLRTFDQIDIVNLHGDIRGGVRTSSTDGDENVFDITQGVTIFICSKFTDSNEHAHVRYFEMVGARIAKYEFLHQSTIKTIDWETLNPSDPNFYFVPKGTDGGEEYARGFSLPEMMPVYSSGVQTKRDSLCIAFDRDTMSKRLEDFMREEPEQLRTKYSLPDDGRDWSVSRAKRDAIENAGTVQPILYRPFDIRYTYYSGESRGFVAYPRRNVMQHVVLRKNLVLIANRQSVGDRYTFVGISEIMNCHGTFYLGNKGQDYAFPLYLYAGEDELDDTRQLNFNPKLYRKLRKLGKHPKRGEPSEVAVLDYIYGVLHCPAYRETYAEFLKIDFPRIPWPASPDVFWDVSDKGGQLRRLHLMEHAAIDPAPFPFTGDGDNKVEKVEFRSDAVWINETQRFENAPEISWNFYIGGYQPAQKWLKDRKGRALDFEDVQHYQRILKILAETDRIMKTIEMPMGTELSETE